MAYNPFGEETGVEDFSNQQATDEERKKRLARMAMLVTGQAGLGDMAGQMLGERVAPISQAIENPQAAIAQRFGQPVEQTQPTQPVAPVAPTVQQPQQEQLQQPVAQQPVTPVTPEQVQLPQPGPATQVAGPTQVQQPQSQIAQVQAQPQAVPQQAEVTKPAMNDIFHDAFVKASNSTDPKERRAAFAQLIGNPQVPEGIKSQANQMFVQDYQNERAKQQAMEKLQTATPNDIARYMQEKTKDEGSYLKAILFKRLGLTELAEQEQEKLSPTLKAASVTDSTTGQRYTAYRNKQGEIVKAFNTEGQTAGQDEIARLSAATLPTSAHQLPAVHGSPVQNAQGQTGLLMYDPQTQSSYVQVGNQRLAPTGWTTMAQNVNSVYGAAGAKQQGTQAAQTGVQQPALPAMAGGTQQAPAVMQQPQVQAQPQSVARPAPVNPATMGQVPQAPAAQPQVQQQPAPQAIVGGGGTVTQRPGESYTSFQQRQKAAEEQTAANIQANKEVNVAERKPPAEAKGKTQAKDIQNQYFADNTYEMIKPIASLIKKSTGSGIGSSIDSLAAKIGASTNGAQAIAELEPYVYPIVSNIPRFEGAQSDYDVKQYQRAAGDFANAEKPVKTRLAALQGMISLLKKYDKEGKNDWSFGEGKPAGTGTTTSGNKYKRVE